MTATSIKDFMVKMGVKGGMSLTSNFDVRFQFSGEAAEASFVQNYQGAEKDIIDMMCDEAQLPNVQSAVGNVTGRYLGEGNISYPHTRIFTDLSLGFLLDADLTAVKFFQAWYDHIFGEVSKSYVSGDMEGALGEYAEPINRVNRVQYPDHYVCTCKIIKTEPNGKSQRGRAPVVYMLENCYPYSIDAVPLSYGASQIARLNVNFYYTRHTVSYGVTA